MQIREFLAIIADIKSNLTPSEDGYELNITVPDNTYYGVSWEWLNNYQVEGKPTILILSKDDHPPIYVSVDSILAVSVYGGR